MEIPKKDGDKIAFYEKVCQDIFASVEERKAVYGKLRSFYMYGTDSGDSDKTYNKIYPTIDQMLAFEFSGETMKFNAKIGAQVDPMFLKRVGKINEYVNDEWHSSNGDIVFSGALEWAHVYGSEFVKLRWSGEAVEPGVVDPHDFGVLREDISQLSRQEAFAQRYWITKSQLENELAACEHPKKAIILQNLQGEQKTTDREGEMMSRLVLTSQMPISGPSTGVGSYAGGLTSPAMYVPRVATDVIRMLELYIYDNELHDFRLVTIANPMNVIFDRPLNRAFVDKELPFVQVCPNPKHDYFFGGSDVERMIPLQMMRNERMDQIRRMMDRQARPPKSFLGFPGVTDEMSLAIDSPGGFIQNDSPASKVDLLSPQIPDDLFKEISYIDTMFQEMTGIQNVMEGRGESGVRSTGHASQLAKLGSARIKKRAMIVEDSLEKVATLYLQIGRKFDEKTELTPLNEPTFAVHQFTDDFIVKVDAHSNSPIFTEDTESKAETLLKAGAITKERFIEFMAMPQEQLLKDDLRTKIEPAEAAAKQEEIAEKRLKLAQGGRH